VLVEYEQIKPQTWLSEVNWSDATAYCYKNTCSMLLNIPAGRELAALRAFAELFLSSPRNEEHGP